MASKAHDPAAYRFFRAHAGSRVGHNAEDALALARAEKVLTEAVDLGVATVNWEPEGGWSWGDLGNVFTEDEMRAKFDSNEWTGPFVASICVDDDHYAASVGMVVLGSRELDDPYARVIAAELAWEILDDLREAVSDALDAERVGGLL